jgi:hypothetical protein
MADWEVEKWEHQLELINRQLEEHEAELLMLQQAAGGAGPSGVGNATAGGSGSGGAGSFSDQSVLTGSG